DWDAVCQVHDAARVLELACGGVDPGAFLPMANVAEDEEFFDSETLVACMDGRVVGFISWNGAYITWMYVGPALHRRGIGRQLLAQAMRRIGPQAWTNAIGGNAPALALYLSMGFELVWVRPSDCDG